MTRSDAIAAALDDVRDSLVLLLEEHGDGLSPHELAVELGPMLDHCARLEMLWALVAASERHEAQDASATKSDDDDAQTEPGPDYDRTAEIVKRITREHTNGGRDDGDHHDNV